MSGDETKAWKHVTLKHSPNEAALVSEIENLLREEERKRQSNELVVVSSESEQKYNNGTNAFKLKKTTLRDQICPFSFTTRCSEKTDEATDGQILLL